MKETSLHLQIYFELALSIGNSLNLAKMLKQSLSAYLRKLNCSGGVVLQARDADEKRALAPVCMIPRRFDQNGVVQEILDRFRQIDGPDELAGFLARLPLHTMDERQRHCHVMALPGFGLLVLVRGNEALPLTVLKSLQPINKKLADACLACLKNEQVKTLVDELKKEAEERQRAQGQLILSTQKYQSIFENIQDVYYEAALDGTILEVSPSVYPTFGYTREELIGTQVIPMYSDPQERDLLLQTLGQEGHVSDYEIGMTNKSGAGIRCAINAVLHRDTSGRPVKIIGSMRDITRRKEAELALAGAKERAVQSAVALKKANKELRKLHRAIEQSPTVVVITDQQGIIEYVNPMFTKSSGYTAEEVVGKKTSLLKSGRQEEAFYKTMWETITDGKVWEGELLNKAKDGRLFWEQAFISPVKDDEGCITHFIAIKEDISWRKAAEAELVKAQQEIADANSARSQFLANMSHEIRTPLNGIIGMTSLLLDSTLDEDQKEMADTIRISADSLMAAVNNILDYAKVMAGQLNLDDAPFQLGALLEDVVSIMQVQLGKKPVKLYHKVAAGVPLELRGDVGRLKQVVINLVSNAVKFTDEGEVVIRAAITDETEETAFFHFTISDTGIGIAPEFQSKIFDCFSQHDAGMNRRFGGTGMGLAISKALVNAMGGDIGFSTQPGRGSLFWFAVKLFKGADDRSSRTAPLPVVQPMQGPQPDRSGKRILVVEDNQINQKLTLKILQKLGYAAEAVSNGREAVDAVMRNSYQLILMDIQMPEMDGLTTTRAIRSEKGNRGGQPVPIVALTAHAMRGDRQACFEAGMDDYLSKPVDPQQLAATIAHHIG